MLLAPIFYFYRCGCLNCLCKDNDEVVNVNAVNNPEEAHSVYVIKTESNSEDPPPP